MSNHHFRSKVLDVQNVSLSLGGKQILRDLSFQIRDVYRPEQVTGQVVGLLGPSGMGKTQLFHVLAGLKKPDAGQVLVGDPGVTVERGMVGVVAQHYPLFEHRTVWSNLIVAGSRNNKSGKGCADRAQTLLERFRLEDRKNAYPSELSGGQRQRVAIAQQIMCSEQFLLMDEPFSGLDVVALDQVQELICEVTNADEVNTTIVVSHDITSVLEICDTVFLLGRDADPSGKLLPGARIKATFDLMERGLAWQKDVASKPEFLELVREIRSRFPLL